VTQTAVTRPVAPAAGPSFAASVGAVATSQLARARVARAPLLFVATVQSVGILLLLRGVVDTSGTGAPDVAAGATVLVAAFVGLNLLSQRFGALRAAAALDYYAALPVSPAAVVLGTAASYAGFALPGAVVTAAVGVALYGLPPIGIALALPCVLLAALPLTGAGAALGLALPRSELATVAGQLGMTAVLFLGIIPTAHLPELLRGVRVLVPGMLAVDALADTMQPHVPWADVVIRLAATAGYGIGVLAVATRAWRRAVGSR
jgi:ABC-2 type transport system permease protein